MLSVLNFVRIPVLSANVCSGGNALIFHAFGYLLSFTAVPKRQLIVENSVQICFLLCVYVDSIAQLLIGGGENLK